MNKIFNLSKKKLNQVRTHFIFVRCVLVEKSALHRNFEKKSNLSNILEINSRVQGSATGRATRPGNFQPGFSISCSEIS